MKNTLLFVPVLALVLVAGPVSADSDVLVDPGTLPGSPFYFLDRLVEQIGTLLTVDKVARIERKIMLAEERFSEAHALSGEQGKSDRAHETFKKYQDDVDGAVADAKAAKEEGEESSKIDEILAKLAEESVRHQAVLAEVYAKVPEQAREAIERAMEMSAQGHTRAIQAVSKEKRDEVRRTVEEKIGDALSHLEEFRAEGVPVPHLDDADDAVEDLDIEDELEGIDGEIRSAADELEDDGRPEDVPRR